jgi:hypothetical protein
MQAADEFLYDLNGNPFHLPGTRIYRERDGLLIYVCPSGEANYVPRRWVKHLVRYATEITAHVI